ISELFARCQSIRSTLLGAVALFALSSATLAADSDQPTNEPSLPSYQRSPNGDSTLPPQFQYQRSEIKARNSAPPRPSPHAKAPPPQNTDRPQRTDGKTANRNSLTRTSATFDAPNSNPDQAPPRGVNRASYQPSYTTGNTQPSYRSMPNRPNYRSASAESV